jgi:hypothetical protein
MQILLLSPFQRRPARFDVDGVRIVGRLYRRVSCKALARVGGQADLNRYAHPAETEALASLPGTPVVELSRTIYAAERAVEVTSFLLDAG